MTGAAASHIMPAMFALALTSATLSLLVLAAHFLRRGDLVSCVATLCVAGALLVMRRRWVLRVTQVLLGLAALKWALTTNELVRQRLAEGGEAGRLGAILGAVIAVNVLAAVLLGMRAGTARYPAAAPQPPAVH